MSDRSQLCPRCGYDLRGGMGTVSLAEVQSVTCPECGESWTSERYHQHVRGREKRQQRILVAAMIGPVLLIFPLLLIGHLFETWRWYERFEAGVILVLVAGSVCIAARFGWNAEPNVPRKERVLAALAYGAVSIMTIGGILLVLMIVTLEIFSL